MVMNIYDLLTGWRVKNVVTLILLFVVSLLNGQSTEYNYFYRVFFSDKGGNTIYSFNPGDLLSTRAINRRQKAGITVPDFRDLPVNTDYINQLLSRGYTLHCVSKWMNTALFKTYTPADINSLLDFPFVIDVKIVKTPGNKNNLRDKLDFLTEQADIPPFDRALSMINGYSLHNSGYDGKGILIAVLDGGFINADLISSLTALRNRTGIKATYDYVGKNKFVYSFHNHGTAVLSVLSGKIPGLIEGTAPGADYLLLRTEDGESEFPVEEDYWAAGAEFADSAGADIISSSLGYYNFDDPALNYKSSDLDGNSAFITKVADIAASKGILVVNSAGNERIKDWKRIIFPADGDSVLAVGAVDGNNFISTFSSAGPSADDRVKPDNVTLGVSVPVQTASTATTRSNGTSFSCPVLSGMAACLMQAVPRAVNMDVIEALRSGSDRYNSPDSLYGYGIPDIVKALTKLQDKYTKIPDEETIVTPNPTTGNIEIIFREPPEKISIEIISMTGKLIFRRNFPDFTGRTLRITELQYKQQGVYFIRLTKATGVYVYKIIKLNN
jgi:serine protease AprX